MILSRRDSPALPRRASRSMMRATRQPLDSYPLRSSRWKGRRVSGAGKLPCFMKRDPFTQCHDGGLSRENNVNGRWELLVSQVSFKRDRFRLKFWIMAPRNTFFEILLFIKIFSDNVNLNSRYAVVTIQPN